MKPIILEINALANICGYFEGSEVNNGYGCNHPDQEEKGKCYAFSCPLSIQPDEKDLKKYSKEDYEDFKVFGKNYDLVMVSDKKIIKNLEKIK